ncbi:hypothetical protein LJR039_000126 [Pseudorhodoferax sp. LjRoot39]|uniref:hypothetical protein n=1 Tax=Pseudorhodoferax sp. LjRoot39 TaxID=3342328 RepID=UPI003ECE264D
MAVVAHDIHGPAIESAGRPTVLLSSGLGGAAAFWKPQVEMLVAAGWRVLAFLAQHTTP